MEIRTLTHRSDLLAQSRERNGALDMTVATVLGWGLHVHTLENNHSFKTKLSRKQMKATSAVEDSESKCYFLANPCSNLYQNLKFVVTETFKRKIHLLINSLCLDHLDGLVVKEFALRPEGVRVLLAPGFFWVESYQWLKYWHSSGYPARHLAL